MLKPAVIKWARQAAELNLNDAAGKVGVRRETFQQWEQGSSRPTQQQVERISASFHIPLHYLMAEQPSESIHLPEAALRLPQGSQARSRPSINLHKTMLQAESRQQWLRDHRQETRGEYSMQHARHYIEYALDEFGRALKLMLENPAAPTSRQYEKLAAQLIRNLWDCGMIVIRNDVVGYDAARRLRKNEFHGFAMPDPLAPLMFINGADSKEQQLHTILHGLSRLLQPTPADAQPAVAQAVAEERTPYEDTHAGIHGLLQHWSELRSRLHPPGNPSAEPPYPSIHHAQFTPQFANSTWRQVPYKSGGFAFLHALISSTVNGPNLYRDAYDMVEIVGYDFDDLAVLMGFPSKRRSRDLA